MEVVINELTSTVEVAEDEGMLDPSVLRRIVQAVTSELKSEEDNRRWEARERRLGGPPTR
jgi:hypothetical protein